MATLLKEGLHPHASDALRKIGITADRVGQTIGGAAASAGLHLREMGKGQPARLVDGKPYCAAVDLRIHDLDRTEIHQLLEKLGSVGFAAWYRNPGEDHWPSDEVEHIHAVYAGTKMKRGLRTQVHDYLAGKNGLASHAPYAFFQPSDEIKNTVRTLFLMRNPAVEDGSPIAAGIAGDEEEEATPEELAHPTPIFPPLTASSSDDLATRLSDSSPETTAAPTFRSEDELTITLVEDRISLAEKTAPTTSLDRVTTELAETNRLLRATLDLLRNGGGASTDGGGTDAEASLAASIRVWEDDPFSEATPTLNPVLATPVIVPQPVAPPAPLAFTIAVSGSVPRARRYTPGTVEFRYWTAFEALARGIRFWAPLLPVGTVWSAATSPLQVSLVAGTDLNAFYARNAGLRFFQKTVQGKVIFSGESPNVVQHELGHALLDALQPKLFNAASLEAASFHESFGDMSSILCMLQLPSLRDKVLRETNGHLNTNSRLSRLAEQLGWAIRQLSPTAVDRDALRNAANRFFYQKPSTLPPSGPASQLTSEPHSFSRVFTGAFLDALAGMLPTLGGASDSNLVSASQLLGKLLVEGIRTARIVPAYYSQVAASMIQADKTLNGGKFVQALGSAFVQHGILSAADVQSLAQSATPQVTAPAMASGMVAASEAVPSEDAALLSYSDDATLSDDTGYDKPFGQTPELPQQAVALSFVTEKSIQVHVSEETARFSVFGATEDVALSSDNDAQAFLEDLIQTGHLDLTQTDQTGLETLALLQPPTRNAEAKTHVLVTEEGNLTLKRRHFDCAFCRR